MKRFLAETTGLFVLLAAPWVVLGTDLSGLLSAGIAIAWLVWSLVAGYRGRPRGGDSQRWQLLSAGLYVGSGGLLAVAVAVGVVLGWAIWAYDLGDDHLISFMPRILAISIATGLALTAAGYFGGLALMRRHGVLSGSLPALARADLAGLFSSPTWLSYAFSFGLIGLMSTVGGAVSMHGVIDQIVPGRTATMTEVAAIFPVLPLGLLATAALLSLSRPLIAGMSMQIDEIRARLNPDAGGISRPPAWRGPTAIAASAVVLASIVHPLHFGMVAALSVVHGIAPWQASSQAVTGWVAEQRDAGRGDAEISAELTAFGHWSPQAPGEGLAALLPALSNGLDTECSVSLAAATADPAAVAGIEWMSDDLKAAGLKYCLRVACPSPVVWQAPAPVILESSHASHRRFWVKNLYLDIFAEGRAAEPGGYCTADGELAAEYQG